MKKTASTKSTLTRAKAAPMSATQLAILQSMPDAKIDYSDIPKSLASELAKNTAGRFFRSIKKPICNYDSDIMCKYALSRSL